MSKAPTIGLGTASLALIDESEADKTIRYALDKGISYFDTAPLYGGGQAEIRLGKALQQCSADDVIISTKVGRYRELGAAAPNITGNADVWDFSETATLESISRSQNRLGREKLDKVFLHDIEISTDQAINEALPLLLALKKQGIVGQVGAGCNTVVGLTHAVNAGVDTILLAGRWTLLDRSAETKLLPLCVSTGTEIIAGGVVNSGLLTQKPTAGMTFDYRPASQTELDVTMQLFDVCASYGIELLTAALQFPTRHPSVDTLLLGASSQQQLSKSLDAMSINIPQQLWDDVAALGFK